MTVYELIRELISYDANMEIEFYVAMKSVEAVNNDNGKETIVDVNDIVRVADLVKISG